MSTAVVLAWVGIFLAVAVILGAIALMMDDMDTFLGFLLFLACLAVVAWGAWGGGFLLGWWGR